MSVYPLLFVDIKSNRVVEAPAGTSKVNTIADAMSVVVMCSPKLLKFLDMYPKKLPSSAFSSRIMAE
jgi:hypothetical protein